MGIYIPSMEMPTDKEQVLMILNKNGLVEVVNQDNILLEEHYAFPVPDHGRLIDADALDADLERQDMRTGEWDAIGFSIEEIENAPTVIPAEEK